MKHWKVTLRFSKDATKCRIRLVTASSLDEARLEVERKAHGWIATRVEDLGFTKFSSSSKVVDGKSLIRLCRGLGSMIDAGVSLEDALRFYAEGVSDRDMVSILEAIRSKLTSGESVREAFASTGRFDVVFLGMVRAGSESGSLGAGFKSLASRVETTTRFRSRLIKALAMPTAVIIFLLAVFVASQITIIPQVEKMLTDVGQEPDLISGFIFQIARFTRILWPFVSMTLIAAIVAVVLRPKWRDTLIRLLGKIWPTFRLMLEGFRQMLFLGVLGMLTRNGISVEDALKVCVQTLSKSPLGDQLQAALQLYQTGLSLAQSLKRKTSCDRVLFHLIGVGEVSGTLDEQLGLLSGLYEEQTQDAMDRFVQAVSLGTIFVAIFLIGFVFIGTYLPIVLIGPRMMQSAL